MNQCEKFNYSYDSIRTLLLDEFVPWKGKKQNLTEPDENNSEENICILKENLIISSSSTIKSLYKLFTSPFIYHRNILQQNENVFKLQKINHKIKRLFILM